MQGYATVAAAEARGEDAIGERVRDGWMRIRETVHLSLGADAGRTADFFACGKFGTALAATGFRPNAGRPNAGRQGSAAEKVSARPPRRAG